MISFAYAEGPEYVAGEKQKKYGYFLMTADIDLAGVNFVTALPSKWVSGKGWSSAFLGTFDGAGHTISNWTLSGGDRGLFIYVLSPAVIKDVKVVNASVGGNTGLIATQAENGSTFRNILVEGKITKGGEGLNPVSLMIAKNGATIQQCVVICSSSVDVSAARAGLIAGRKIGGVVDNVGNNLVINLSNQTALKIYDNGGANVSVSTELASATNKLFTSYADYLAVKDSLTQGAWAKELIASIMAERCAIDETQTQLLGDSSLTLNLNLDYVQNIALEGEVPAGVTLNAQTGVLTATVDAGAGMFDVVVTFKTGEVKTLTLKTVVNRNVNLEEVNHDVRSAGKTLTVDLSGFAITEVTSISNGASFNDGIFTMPVAAGKTDWGEMEFSLVGQTQFGAITLKIPAFVYVSIANATELQNMYNFAYAAGTDIYGKGQDKYGYYIMTADINLAGSNFSTVDGAYWSGSLKTWSARFAGTFDGQGHTISNWNNVGANRGIFVSMISPAVFKNVNFVNVTTGGATGVVATEALHGAKIQNVLVEGKITSAGSGTNPVSLVVAKNGATIENCVVICTSAVDFGSTYAGLLAGNKVGGVPENVRNNLVINLSGKTLSMYNGAAVSAGTELASSTNKLITSAADYLAAKDSITQGAWAKDFLTAYFAN